MSDLTHTHTSLPLSPAPMSLLGLMASKATCTLLREMSAALAGLPCRQGDRERNSGLPGAEPRLWTWAWDSAGEPGMEPWRREAVEGGGAAAVVIPKLPPLAVIWLDTLTFIVVSTVKIVIDRLLKKQRSSV